MALYSRRMQIEQNFRDDKSPRFVRSEAEPESGKGRLEVLEYGRGNGKPGDVGWQVTGQKGSVYTGTIRQAASGTDGFCHT